MPPARVVAVAPGSPAAAAGMLAGDEVISVNGKVLRDVIDYQVQADEPTVEIELRRGGLERTLVVEKTVGRPLGVELASAVFDRVRTCDNHCPFCFVYQLPKGMRRSLYVKDDDYRLSFLYGNFTTLTRFTEVDLERVITDGLGPLYVSIHATDPEVRASLLRNRRGATSLRWLGLLLEAGIEVHGQIVVCPGLNDRCVLQDTLLGVLDRYSRLASVGIVPVGVSRHATEAQLRPHRAGEAAAVLDTVDEWQQRFLAALGRRVAFAADEYYLLADRRLPAIEEYEGLPQLENGIGMARCFEAEVLGARRARLPEARKRGGFFASIDGAPADGYRSERGGAQGRGLAAQGTGERRPVALVTGELGERVLGPILAELTRRSGAGVRTLAVTNRYFGGNVSVTGLLTGEDVAAALAGQPEGERYLLPDVVLSEGRFLDGLTPAELPRRVEIVGTDGASLVAALAVGAAA